MAAVTMFLAAGIGYLLGSLRYSPLLFGTHWMKLIKKKKQDTKMIPVVIRLGAVGSLIGALYWHGPLHNSESQEHLQEQHLGRVYPSVCS